MGRSFHVRKIRKGVTLTTKKLWFGFLGKEKNVKQNAGLAEGGENSNHGIGQRED